MLDRPAPTPVASGNIGCLTQMRTHLRELEPAPEAPGVLHTIELLDRAFDRTT